MFPSHLHLHFCYCGTEVPLCPLSAVQLWMRLFSPPAWSQPRGEKGVGERVVPISGGLLRSKWGEVQHGACTERVLDPHSPLPSVPCSVKPLGHAAVWWQCGVLIPFILLRIKLRPRVLTVLQSIWRAAGVPPCCCPSWHPNSVIFSRAQTPFVLKVYAEYPLSQMLEIRFSFLILEYWHYIMKYFGTAN